MIWFFIKQSNFTVENHKLKSLNISNRNVRVANTIHKRDITIKAYVAFSAASGDRQNGCLRGNGNMQYRKKLFSLDQSDKNW